MKTKAIREAQEKINRIQADRLSNLTEKGDQIAKLMKYPGLDGMDAIVRYLVDKHHWLPSDVQHLTQDELFLVLDGEFPQLRI